MVVWLRVVYEYVGSLVNIFDGNLVIHITFDVNLICDIIRCNTIRFLSTAAGGCPHFFVPPTVA
jgi:hypothetical protein